MEFRNDIQGLRALAVIFVFIFHLSKDWLPGGFIGVDIFFVISGYLISSIIRHKIQRGSFTLISFYEGRIKRIVPAYLFLLIVISVIAALMFVRSDIAKFRVSLFWTMIFNSNNYFATLDNYFGASSNENPLLHTWTLAIEMQFYFILPLLLMLVRNTKVLIGILLGLLLLLTGYSTYNMSIGRAGEMYFSLPARIPEFIMGILAASMNLRNLKFIKTHSAWIAGFGVLVLISTAFLINETTPFPGTTALIPCLGTVCLLIASNNNISDFFSRKPLVFLGEISYSVYLWHWPVMALWRYYKNSYAFSPGEMVWVVIITIAASLMSYYLIEKSMRTQKRWKFYFPFTIMGAATAAMVFFAIKINRKVFQDSVEFMYPSFGKRSHGPTFKGPQIFGDTTSSPEVLFLGDSHAMALKRYFDLIGERNGFSFKTITDNTFPTIPGITMEEIKDRELYTQHTNLMEHVEAEIPKSKLIILQFGGNGSRWMPYMQGFLSELGKDQRILILEDFPTLNKNPIRINKRIVRNPDIEQVYALRWKPMCEDMIELIDEHPNARLVQLPTDVFENAPFYNDTLMYFDSGHLNVFGSEKYALSTEEEIMDAIEWGMGEPSEHRLAQSED